MEILDVFVGVVQNRMIVGANLNQCVVNAVGLVEDRTVQLTHCILGSFGSFGMDDVDDCFRLGQVHAAVQEGALGEFTCTGLSGTCFEQGFQTCAEHHWRAVGLQLSGIFSCVAAGSAGNGAQADIQNGAVGIYHVAVHQLTVGVGGHGLAGNGLKYFVNNGECVIAGHAENADCGNDSACCNGGNGIGHRKITSGYFSEKIRVNSEKLWSKSIR